MTRDFLIKIASSKHKFEHFLTKHKIPNEHFHINKKSITRGILIGLFWGFIPMPMQMLAVILTAPIVRFNIIIAFAMVWLSNPFTMPAMYYMEYLTGNFILGMEKIDNIHMNVEWFSDNLDKIVIPLYTGAMFYSIIVSSIIYFIINILWDISVKNHKEKRKNNEKNQNKSS